MCKYFNHIIYMYMFRPFIVIVLALCLCSCGNKNKNNAEQIEFKIKMPDIPAMFVSDMERREYLAVHFWDNLNFSDTTFLAHNAVLDQAFADYLASISAVPYDVAAYAINGMLAKAVATPAVFDRFTELYEHYLYDPNSPARNEELYIPVLEFIVNSDKVDDISKLRPRSQLEMAMKNRVGHKAADITVRTADGRKVSLYGTDAEYIILYINNPDCHACAEVTAQLVNSGTILSLLQNGVARIFAVYPDEDIAAWRNHLPKMPAGWINGYDESLEMRDAETYDLRAIPSLYLLDRNKNVLIKDAASVAPLEMFFQQNARS